jgi:NADH-quinone oxidoreductase subunit L
MSEWLHEWLDPVTHAAQVIREDALLASGAIVEGAHYHGFLKAAPFGGSELTWAIISTVAALIVVVVAVRVVGGWQIAPAKDSPEPQGFGKVLFNKWYVDELYDRIVVQPILRVSRFLWKIVDQGIIDGLVNITGGLAKLAGFVVSLFQTGSVNTYAVILTLGVLAVLLGVGMGF